MRRLESDLVRRGQADLAPRPYVSDFLSNGMGVPLILWFVMAVFLLYFWTWGFWPPLFVAFVVELALGPFILYATIIANRVLCVQESRVATWEENGKLPAEIAEELRAYWYGEELILLGVKDPSTQDMLTFEAKCWLSSNKNIHTGPAGGGPCGRCRSGNKHPEREIRRNE